MRKCKNKPIKCSDLAGFSSRATEQRALSENDETKPLARWHQHKKWKNEPINSEFARFLFEADSGRGITDSASIMPP